MVLLAFALVLCLPVLQAMRSYRLSPAMGIIIIAVVCLVFVGPWVFSDIAARRRLRKLMDEDKERKDP
jgi:hypothetical protein